MYFITKINSETGKKFQALKAKFEDRLDAVKLLQEKYGFKNIYMDDEAFGGGVHSVAGFIEDPDSKHWRKIKATSGYYPSKRTLKGREILKDFEAIQGISSEDINSCVGFCGGPVYTIGFNMNSDKYFGFQVGDDWVFTAPDDCEEVTRYQYLEIFKK
ncbi:MAG: hypothetical protein AB7E45_04365 [Candidatus Caldatribacteriota bacterium]